MYDWSGIQIGTFSHINHTKTRAFFRSVQTRHFLLAVVPPGGKTYQTGFVIFSSKLVMLWNQEVCFIATSTLYDWRRIQEDMFVDI